MYTILKLTHNDTKKVYVSFTGKNDMFLKRLQRAFDQQRADILGIARPLQAMLAEDLDSTSYTVEAVKVVDDNSAARRAVAELVAELKQAGVVVTNTTLAGTAKSYTFKYLPLAA